MSCPEQKYITQLKAFIELCEHKPEVLHDPDLLFFKTFIESLGGKIPVPKTKTMPKPDKEPESPSSETNEANLNDEDDSDPESLLEFDMEGCVDKDEVASHFVGDESKVPTVEEEDQADEKRIEAMSQFSEGNLEKCIELYTEAITLNPQHAILFTKRGQAYLKLKKPMACIQDCTHALKLNCDSAPAYKFRGRAYRLIAEWEKSAVDLRQACKIDFDEQADEWLREVQPNAKRIEQHKLKFERKLKEKSDKEKLERVKKAREAHSKATEANKTKQDDGGGAAEEQPGMGDFFELFKDPEMMAACMDPEISAAFEDISANPQNFTKYQDNPKVKSFIEKFQSKIPGGIFTQKPGGTTPSNETDDGLD